MKKIVSLFLLFITISSNAQINLEHTYPATIGETGNTFLVKLSSSGYKYVHYSELAYSNDPITLYNLDHSVFKTMTTPIGSEKYSDAYYFSEELFDTDSTDIEYIRDYYDTVNGYHGIRVLDENGNILFSEDSAYLFDNYGGGYENSISYTTSGVKMIITKWNSSGHYIQSVYSLPGSLPCSECNNGIVTSIFEPGVNHQNSGISKLYPNPTNGQTTIEYTLPQGTATADLVIFDMKGFEIKRYKVTNVFDNIIIDAGELQSGTYYFQIQTTSGLNEGRKMIVIK
jgi:hypothetical protein